MRNNTLVAGELRAGAGHALRRLRPDLAAGREATANYGTLDAELQGERRAHVARAARHVRRATARRRRRTCPRRAGRRHRRELESARHGRRRRLRASAPTDNSTPFPGGTPVDFGWIFGAQTIDVEDKEDWAQIDADFALDNGAWTNLKFGARYNEHERESHQRHRAGSELRDPERTGCGTDTANYPTTFQNYPSDFNPFGGNFPTNVWFWSPAQLAACNGHGLVQPRSGARARTGPVRVRGRGEERAAYVQADFEGSNWSGNVGLRYVQTKEDVTTFTQTSADDPGAIPGSLFGSFKRHPGRSHVQRLAAEREPEVRPDATTLVARFAVAKTMTRPDYSALAGLPTCRRRPRRAASAPATAATRTWSRSARPTSTPGSSGTSRRARCCRRRPLLHGPRQLRRLRQRDQDLPHVQLAVPGRRGSRSTC